MTLRQMSPLVTFARNRGIEIKGGPLSTNIVADDTSIDWNQYHPILPIGSMDFLQSLKQTNLASYVLANAGKFTPKVWRARLGNLMCRQDTPASCEWRCWIVGNRVIDVSQYSRDGKEALLRGAPADVVEFAYRVTHTWLPEPCLTMDVAMTDQGLRVVRFSTIHSSGWYAASVNVVLLAWLKWTNRYLS